MTSIVVFGAGGRAGRAVTAEAGRRGLRVTAVVRDPARHPDVAGAVAGDVTSPERVAAGHDVAVCAVYSPDADPQQLYGEGARTLLAGLERAGVARLLVVGLATTLEGASGTRVFEADDFPAPWRPFSLGRVAELQVLENYRGPVDWVVFTPPMELVAAETTGRYHIGKNRRLLSGSLSYGDLASAVLDEVVSPVHHRIQLSVGA